MSRQNYQEVEQIRSGEVVCIVTEHIPTKRRSFMFAKEYARNGELARTSFLSERHIEDILALAQQVQDKL